MIHWQSKPTKPHPHLSPRQPFHTQLIPIITEQSLGQTQATHLPMICSTGPRACSHETGNGHRRSHSRHHSPWESIRSTRHPGGLINCSCRIVGWCQSYTNLPPSPASNLLAFLNAQVSAALPSSYPGPPSEHPIGRLLFVRPGYGLPSPSSSHNGKPEQAARAGKKSRQIVGSAMNKPTWEPRNHDLERLVMSVLAYNERFWFAVAFCGQGRPTNHQTQNPNLENEPLVSVASAIGPQNGRNHGTVRRRHFMTAQLNKNCATWNSPEKLDHVKDSKQKTKTIV